MRQLFVDDPACIGLIPVGATEQHGPHLPSGTDTIIATALAEALSGFGGAVVLPAVAVGASWWHGTSLGSTLALSSEVVAELVVSYVRWAAHSGLRRVLFVNGHVGNGAALWLACDRLRFEQPELFVGVLEWWKLSPAISAEVLDDAQDWHAHRAETALMLALAPQLVDLQRAATADEPDRSADLVFSYGAPMMTGNGVTGSPSRATAELGSKLWASIVAAGQELIARGRLEAPPIVPAP